MCKAKSNKELWAFLFNDFLLLTHAAKQFTSSGPDKLFSNRNNTQLKMYKPVSHTHTHLTIHMTTLTEVLHSFTPHCMPCSNPKTKSEWWKKKLITLILTKGH